MGIDEVAPAPSPGRGPPLAILDRDGTLIDVVRDEETGAISVAFHPSHLRLLDGVVEGLTTLASAGFLLAIATNQPGPAKGQYSAEAILRTNAALLLRLAQEGLTIARVKVCMHHPKGGPGGDASLVGPCACRKPKAGMLEELLAETGADRARSWMIGDSTSDVEAGRAAHVRSGLVFATNRCELCPLRAGPASGMSGDVHGGRTPDVHGPSLRDVADRIVRADRAQVG